MPLQLRRGTTSERQSITPLVSELIYDTQQNLVYVGNGVTPGGVAIDQDSSPDLALSDLNNVVIDGLSVGEIIKYNGTNWVNGALAVTDLSDVEFTNIQTNQLLKWNGTAWVNDVISPTDLPGNFVGDVTGSVFADDSTMMIDATEGRIVGPVFANVTGNVSGNLIGNVTGDLLGNVTGNVSGNLIGNVTGDLLGNVTGDLLGNVTGDLLGNVTGDLLGNVTGDLLGNVTGDLLGNLVGSVFADDNTLLVDGINGTVPWAVISDAPVFLTEIPGSITADVTGSIFGDDSSIIVDSVNGIISIGNIVIPNNLSLEITNANLNSPTRLFVLSDNESSRLALVRTSAADISGPGIEYGVISFQRNDINGEFTTGVVAGYSSGIIFGSTDVSGNVVDAGLISSANGANIGIGTSSPSVNANVDIRGILKLEPQSSPPAVLEEGMVAVANRVDWDPAAKGTGGSYPVYYDGTVWQAFF